MGWKEIGEKYWPKGDIAKTLVAGQQTYNSYGYRADEFDRRGVLNIQMLGCSWTQGPAAFPSVGERLCRRLSDHFDCSVANWNMGLGGCGLDFMARTLLCSIDHLRPDVCFIIFPGVDRREYFTEDGALYRYQADYRYLRDRRDKQWTSLPPLAREIYGHFADLENESDNAAHLLTTYKLMQLCLDQAGVAWGFSMVPPEYVVQPIKALLEAGWMDRAHYLGSPFDLIDFASDNSHPGPESNERFAGWIFDWLLSHYGETLRAKVDQAKAAAR